jgi:hypothetical protein
MPAFLSACRFSPATLAKARHFVWHGRLKPQESDFALESSRNIFPPRRVAGAEWSFSKKRVSEIRFVKGHGFSRAESDRNQ